MKRFFAVVITVCMLITVITCGCSNKSDEAVSGSETTKSGSTGQETSKSGTNTQQKKPVTLTYVLPEMNGQVQYRNDFPVIQELSKRTNVIIDFQAVPEASYADKFNLMVSSGDMPDIMSYTYDLINKSGVDGAFVDLDELSKKHAPNIKKFFDRKPEYRRVLRAGDGKIYALPKWTFLTTTVANFVRKDWMDKVGITKIPETLDEMETLLKAFRDKDPNGNKEKDEVPFSTRCGNVGIELTFADPFGVSSCGWGGRLLTVDNGTLIYGPVDPRYKEALKYMNHLFKEKLIDEEFATIDPQLYDAKMSNNKIGSYNYWISYTLGQNKTMKETIPDFEWVGIPALKGQSGKAQMWCSGQELVNAHCAGITIKNKYPVETIKFFDYIYSDEGSEFINWGIKDKHYTVKDGKKSFTDLIINSEKYESYSDAMNNEGLHLYIPFIFDEDAWWNLNPDESQKKVRAMYRENYLMQNQPALPLSTEENEKVTTIMDEIKSYKEEMSTKFIMGDEPIEKFDEYVSKIKNMGLDKVLEIYNKRYQEYLKN